MTTKRLLLCVMAMLTVFGAKAATETYDFQTMANALSDDKEHYPIYSSSRTFNHYQNSSWINIFQMSYGDSDLLGGRFAAESRTSNGFNFRKSGSDWIGLNSGYAGVRYFSILNLEVGDKVTITYNQGELFTYIPLDENNNTVSGSATMGLADGAAVVSGTEYTITAAGRFDIKTGSAKVNITKVVITPASDTSTDNPTDNPSTPEPSTTGNYTVTINEATNGTVTSSHAKADAGTEVTLTVTPTDATYKLVDLTIEQVTAEDGDNLSLAPRRSPGFIGYITPTKVDDTHYKFTMPENNVVISATFTDIPVAKPTVTYDADNNKVTLALGAAQTIDNVEYAANTEIWYTTDGTDPKTSTTKKTSTTGVAITVTADITQIRVVGVNNNHFSVEVNQEVSLVRYLNVTKEWSAFCSPETFQVPSGLKAYTITAVTQPTASATGSVTLTEQNIIAADVPMIIENTKPSEQTAFKIETATGSVSGQCSEFKGSATGASTLSSSNANYVLKNGSFIRTTATQVSKYGCYLEFTNATSANSFNIVVDGNMTAIKSLGVATLDEGAWYTLNGLRVAQPTQKGIYIHQGKKVVIK